MAQHYLRSSGDTAESSDDSLSENENDWELVSNESYSLINSMVHDCMLSYYKNLQQLIDLTQLSKDFQIIMTGYGFDLFSVSSHHNHAGIIHNFGFLQTALFLNLKSVVLMSASAEFVRNFSLVLYMEKTSNPGYVSLYMSVKTSNLLTKSKCGFGINNATVLQNSASGNPKFYLSSNEIIKGFESSKRPLLLAYCKHLRKKNSRQEIILKEGPLSGCQIDYYATRYVPILLCPLWPDYIIHEWMGASRRKKRLWPPEDVVESVSKTECFISPYRYNDCPAQNNEWSFRFDAAEKFLFSKLDAAQGDSFACIVEMLFNGKFISAAPMYFLLRNSFLWCLELDPTHITHLSGAVITLQRMENSLMSSTCAHYFIPSVNILENIDNDVRCEMLAIISRVLQTVNVRAVESTLMVHVELKKSAASDSSLLLPIKSGNSSSSFPKLSSYAKIPCQTAPHSRDEIMQIVKRFKDIFNENSEILLLQAYANLRVEKFADEVIDEHRAILDMLERHHSGIVEIKTQVKLFVMASLAMTLALNALQSPQKSRRDHLIEAEQCLQNIMLESVHPVYKIHLAIIYAIQSKHEAIVQLLGSDTEWNDAVSASNMKIKKLHSERTHADTGNDISDAVMTDYLINSFR